MTETANPLDVETVPWVPLRDGLAFRPLHFEHDGYSLQLRLSPGAVIPRHRHTGEVHALNLSGYREIIETGEILGPGAFVHEPAGNEDSWRCIGEGPCVVHISLKGRVEYLDEAGEVSSFSDTGTAQSGYLEHCQTTGMPVDPTLFSGLGGPPP